jgi:hypothetical protein
MKFEEVSNLRPQVSEYVIRLAPDEALELKIRLSGNFESGKISRVGILWEIFEALREGGI